MASVNKVILIGHLGKDPETRTFQNGGRVANVSLATSESWTDKRTGEKREATEWHNLVFNDKLAEIAGKYLNKGSFIYVEGSLKTRKWQDMEGQDRYVTEIRVRELRMLGGKPEEAVSPRPLPGERRGGNLPPAASSAPAPDDFGDDDIPF